MFFVFPKAVCFHLTHEKNTANNIKQSLSLLVWAASMKFQGFQLIIFRKNASLQLLKQDISPLPKIPIGFNVKPPNPQEVNVTRMNPFFMFHPKMSTNLHFPLFSWEFEGEIILKLLETSPCIEKKNGHDCWGPMSDTWTTDLHFLHRRWYQLHKMFVSDLCMGCTTKILDSQKVFLKNMSCLFKWDSFSKTNFFLKSHMWNYGEFVDSIWLRKTRGKPRLTTRRISSHWPHTKASSKGADIFHLRVSTQVELAHDFWRKKTVTWKT